MFEKFLNLIYFKRCLWCFKKIDENSTYTCEKCGNILKYRLNKGVIKFIPNMNFELLISCFLYKDEIRKKILEFKFYNKPYLGRLFAEYMVELLVQNNIKVDLIIAVPMHRLRYFERGYNQSDILARVISKKLGVKYRLNILRKTKKSKVQSTLDAVERKNNVKDTYEIKLKNEICNRTILLVDDIYTTGATVNECARILKENGASKVIVTTIAYGNFSKEEI